MDLRHITKRYPENDVLAVRDVSLELRPGEIHALIGENGAGKSTLMKIAAGLLSSYDGEVRSRATDICRLVQQHPQFIPQHQVWENLFLGIEPRTRWGLLNQEAAVRDFSGLAGRYAFPVEPRMRAEGLSAAQAQLAAILGALLHNPDTLILDEPTAPCSDHETALVFEMMRSLRNDGRAVVLITHKLREVMEVSDRITVMRHGRVVGSLLTADTTLNELSSLMIGEDYQRSSADRRFGFLQIDSGTATQRSPVEKQDLETITAQTSLPNSQMPETRVDPVFELREVSLVRRGRTLLDRLDLKLYPGEILGVTGIRENGLEYIEDILSGSTEPNSGEVRIQGSQPSRYTPRAFRKLGLAYIPTDRLMRGASLSSSVEDNMILLDRKRFGRAGLLNRRASAHFSSALQQKYGITAVLGKPMHTLSGGNMQKVILSRELSQHSPIVVFSEPSWGLDFRSSERIHDEIHRLSETGVGIILISSDIDEILSLCDRIVVMYKGNFARTLHGDERVRDTIGELMLGIEPEHSQSGAAGAVGVPQAPGAAVEIDSTNGAKGYGQ